MSRIQTRDFGELEIDEREIITFRSPIYGFEEYTRFVLLYDDTIEGPLAWLQCVEERDICFILTDPFAVADGYAPRLQKAERTLLGFSDADEPVFRSIMVIPESGQGASLNLKSPVVINPALRCAAQVILEEDYPVRALLTVGEEDVSC